MGWRWRTSWLKTEFYPNAPWAGVSAAVPESVRGVCQLWNSPPERRGAYAIQALTLSALLCACLQELGIGLYWCGHPQVKPEQDSPWNPPDGFRRLGQGIALSIGQLISTAFGGTGLWFLNQPFLQVLEWIRSWSGPCHLPDLVSNHFPLSLAPATLASFLFFLNKPSTRLPRVCGALQIHSLESSSQIFKGLSITFYKISPLTFCTLLPCFICLSNTSPDTLQMPRRLVGFLPVFPLPLHRQ